MRVRELNVITGVVVDRDLSAGEVAGFAAAADKESKDGAKAKIVARLAEIDTSGVRALREIVAAQAGGKAVPGFAKSKIDTLETEAAALRAELAAL